MHYYGWHLTYQIYALNLVDSHSGQKQAPQLFSSSKSFHVAKSMLLSVIFSTRLLPISKWLSKPSLLFKPSLLSKPALVFAPLLLLSYTQDVQALTAQTSRVIEGSAPYLMFDGGQTKATNTDTVLAIELPDGRRITQSTNTSSATNPIMLPSGNFTFNDIHMVIPSGASSTSLNSLISQGMWGDDDGDGQGVGEVTATGSISLTIKDKDGSTVNRGDTLSLCKVPYKLTLNNSGGRLETRYGMPKTSRFYRGIADYYIALPSQPVICYARPNLYNGIGNRAGPPNIWNSDKGFLVQSTSPSSYGLNFPTTGSDGLYFDLDIDGIDESQLSWTVNTSGSISATVSWTRPLTGTFTSPDNSTVQADDWIGDKSKNVTRVTLSGPKADSAQISSSSPGRITVPSLPQAFELVGSDRSGNEVRYGFVLKQWFVNRSAQRAKVSNQTAWCNSLGYQMPAVRDLTNAVRTGTNPISGAAPNSSVNYYMRYIGAGFFTEWGSMNNYAAAGFVSNYYWTSDATGSNQFYVSSNNGYVNRNSASYSRYGFCSAL